MTLNDLKAIIRDVPDFPKPGIVFRDITPLLAHPEGFDESIRFLAERVRSAKADAIVAIESRGFIFGAPVARELGLPMHLCRKPGKLPHVKVGVDYELEYGTDRVEMHADAVVAGKRYAIVDDLIATGGTAEAAARLIEEQGGVIACCLFLIELSFLPGRKRLGDRLIETLLTY